MCVGICRSVLVNLSMTPRRNAQVARCDDQCVTDTPEPMPDHEHAKDEHRAPISVCGELLLHLPDLPAEVRAAAVHACQAITGPDRTE
jgi:hypothetical protein